MNNHNHQFNKHTLLLATLIFLSLATGYLLGSQSLNKLLDNQKKISTIVNPKLTSSPNITGVTAKTQNQIITEDQAKENEKNVLDIMKDYNQSLLDTILLSLLGTVVTISFSFFGYQWFSSILSREQDKADIQRKLQDWLQQHEIANIQQSLWTKTEERLDRIEIKLKWLEYQIAVLSAEQIEMQHLLQPPITQDNKEYQKMQKLSQQPILLQEHIRAIDILYNLPENQGSAVRQCLEEEFASIKYIFANLTKDNLNNQTLHQQIQRLQGMFENLRNIHSQDINEDIKEIEQEIKNFL